MERCPHPRPLPDILGARSLRSHRVDHMARPATTTSPKARLYRAFVVGAAAVAVAYLFPFVDKSEQGLSSGA